MTARRRIMLVEMRPLVPQARTYATWSPTDKDPGVTLTSGNLKAQVAGSPSFVAVRATVPLGQGITYWETTLTTGVGALDNGRAGIAMEQFPLDEIVGNDVAGRSASAPDKFGDAYYRGAKVIDLANIASGTVLRHRVDRTNGVYSVAVGAGDFQTVLAHSAISRMNIYPVASLVDYGAITANFGATPFAYDVPKGATAGVFYVPDPVPTTIHLASEPLGTYADDDPPNTLYLARIDKESDLVISRSASCWVWGNQSQSDRGTLTILNGDRRLDHWIGWNWRDAQYSILSGYSGDSRDDFTVYARGVIDQISLDGDRRIVVTLANPLARLDRPVQTRLYTNADNAQLVDKPRPIAIGRPLYVPGVLLSTTEFGAGAWNYDVHESAAAGMDALYDRGDAFETVDWEWLASGTGIRLLNKPAGKVCLCPRGATIATGSPLLDTNFASLTGWSNESTGAATVTASGTTGRWQSGVGTLAVLRRAGVLTSSSGLVRVDVAVSAVTKGELTLRVDPAGTVRMIRAAGTLSAILDATGQDDLLLFTSGLADITVSSITVTPVRLAETLPDCMRYLLIDKAGLDESEVDWDSVDALHALAPYRIADYIDSEETFIGVLRRWLDSWCGYVTVNRLGQITVGRIGDAPGTPLRKLSTLNVRTVSRRLDEAKGLTTRLAGGKNYSVHSDGDLATSVPAALRAILKAEYTQIRSSTVPESNEQHGLRPRISFAYKHADGAPFQATVLQEPDQLQVEINRVAHAWSDDKGRAFRDINAVLAADQGSAMEPGQTDELTWPTYDTAGGKSLVASSVTTRFFGRSIDLTASDFED